jgi:hypothetical protein
MRALPSASELASFVAFCATLATGPKSARVSADSADIFEFEDAEGNIVDAPEYLPGELSPCDSEDACSCYGRGHRELALALIAKRWPRVYAVMVGAADDAADDRAADRTTRRAEAGHPD